MDDWSALIPAGSTAGLFLVLVMLILRLASHLSADRANQLKQLAELRASRRKEVHDLTTDYEKQLKIKEDIIQDQWKQINELRRQLWATEDKAARYRRLANIKEGDDDRPSAAL